MDNSTTLYKQELVAKFTQVTHDLRSLAVNILTFLEYSTEISKEHRSLLEDVALILERIANQLDEIKANYVVDNNLTPPCTSFFVYNTSNTIQ